VACRAIEAAAVNVGAALTRVLIYWPAVAPESVLPPVLQNVPRTSHQGIWSELLACSLITACPTELRRWLPHERRQPQQAGACCQLPRNSEGGPCPVVYALCSHCLAGLGVPHLWRLHLHVHVVKGCRGRAEQGRAGMQSGRRAGEDRQAVR
jgi:hypothetical protein